MRKSITDWAGTFRSKVACACLFITLGSLFGNDLLLAKQLYSYRDDQGINVITDSYDRIPERYRAKVVSVEQDSDSTTHTASIAKSVSGLINGADKHLGNAKINVPGMTDYQSHALTITGALALLCFALRKFSKSQTIRFFSLWGLVMLGLVAPVLIYFSQDAPLDILRGEAAHIQDKQSQHLKQVN